MKNNHNSDLITHNCEFISCSPEKKIIIIATANLYLTIYFISHNILTLLHSKLRVYISLFYEKKVRIASLCYAILRKSDLRDVNSQLRGKKCEL